MLLVQKMVCHHVTYMYVYVTGGSLVPYVFAKAGTVNTENVYVTGGSLVLRLPTGLYVTGGSLVLRLPTVTCQAYMLLVEALC